MECLPIPIATLLRPTWCIKEMSKRGKHQGCCLSFLHRKVYIFLRQREAPCIGRSSVAEMLYKLTGLAGDTGSLLYGVYLVLLNSQRQ